MVFFFDDIMYLSYKAEGEGIGEWPFFEPQYLIFNQALWNKWREGRPGIDDSIFPPGLIVAYLRIYELE